MEETPDGTPVGVDDPYAHAGRCDHLTDDGRCRFALAHAGADPEFTRERRQAEYACVVAEEDTGWRDCPHYRSTTDGTECTRCGLTEVRMAHDDSRPLVEEHHLSYGGRGSDGRSSGGRGSGRETTRRSDLAAGDDDAAAEQTHEITVALCRWCHAKVHAGWARIDDDAEPDAEAIAQREARRSEELSEAGFSTAAERFDLNERE